MRRSTQLGAWLTASIFTRRLRERFVHAVALDRLPRVRGAMQWAITFAFVSFAWIFFRAASLSDALHVVSLIPRGLHDLATTRSLRALAAQCGADASTAIAVFSIGVMEIVQWFQERGSVRTMLSAKPLWLRWGFYYAAMAWVLFFGKLEVAQFIYFQF